MDKTKQIISQNYKTRKKIIKKDEEKCFRWDPVNYDECNVIDMDGKRC